MSSLFHRIFSFCAFSGAILLFEGCSPTLYLRKPPELHIPARANLLLGPFVTVEGTPVYSRVFFQALRQNLKALPSLSWALLEETNLLRAQELFLSGPYTAWIWGYLYVNPSEKNMGLRGEGIPTVSLWIFFREKQGQEPHLHVIRLTFSGDRFWDKKGYSIETLLEGLAQKTAEILTPGAS